MNKPEHRYSRHRVISTRLLALCLCACALLSNAFAADSGDWRDYFGNQSRAAPWAGLVRGIGLGTTGLGRLESDRRPHGRQPADIASLSTQVSGLAATHDVLLPVGGLDSARRQEIVDRYMKLIESDAGQSWKRIVHDQTVAVERAAKNPGRVYWQVGNEINSRHYDLSFRTWKGEVVAGVSEPPRRQMRERPARRRPAAPGAEAGNDGDDDGNGERERRSGGTPNDAAVIPLYVEYLLAPTVEALDGASRELYGAPGRIPIVLGSLANARSAAASQWLDQLLNYKVEGRFAPSLKGKHVYELVDTIAIHYVVSYPGNEWRQTLDRLHTRWVGKGRIHGVWSTEELGRRRALRGLGAATTLRVAFRYLDWALTNNIAPKYARVNFWGADLGDPGTTGDEGMKQLYDWLGKGTVTRLPTGQKDGALEHYGLATADNRRKAFVLFPAGESGSVRVDRIVLPGAPATRQEAHLFAAEGHRVLAAHTQASQNGSSQLTLDAPLTLQADQTLLVLQDGK